MARQVLRIVTVKRPQEEPPGAQSFLEVHCHELSTDELVYFTDEPVPSAQVIVRLRGDDTEIMLVAAVVGHRRAFFEGRWRSRVECRFTKRLEPAALSATAKAPQ